MCRAVALACDVAPSSLSAPVVAVLPFVLLLTSIAVLPLVVPRFWERNRHKGLVVAILSAPIAYWLIWTHPSSLIHSLLEYGSFICLLGSLYIIAGGIHVAGNLTATPVTNCILLGVGAGLASIIGTTGASMVMIRLVLQTNSERRNTWHIPFFFILVVSNCGGLLTPLGDPPLFLGYLRGVPFFWTFRLFPYWLLATSYLIGVFFWLDRQAYGRESPSDLALDRNERTPIAIVGKLNVVFLLVVVAAVFLDAPYRELTMLLAATGSLVLGPTDARHRNHFEFGPIIEVAVLFAGIFVTMVPALELLRNHGESLGLSAPWHFFLATGTLSSVLDNAPTYLTFLATAQGLGLSNEVVGIPTVYLTAISCGAVLMGANTYIGNGPNFMVKSIADAAGYETRSFVGYALRAAMVLAPIYALIAASLL